MSRVWKDSNIRIPRPFSPPLPPPPGRCYPERMPPLRILITGVDGFVGRRLQAGLKAAGHDVVGTVFREPPAGPHEVHADITRAERPAALEGPFDAVVHNAGAVDQRLPGKVLWAINAEGTRHVLTWARDLGVAHFVQISSTSVLGLRTMGENRREDTPRTRWLGVPYQRAKAQGERYVEASGLPYTIVRLPGIVGAGDTFQTEAIAGSMLSDRYFQTGDGTRRYSIIYVDSIPVAVSRVLAEPTTNTIYNLADAHPTWNEVADAYAAELGMVRPATRRSLLALVAVGERKEDQLLSTFSRFGGHYPTDRFEARFGPLDPDGTRWRRAISEAVAALVAGRGGRTSG